MILPDGLETAERRLRIEVPSVMSLTQIAAARRVRRSPRVQTGYLVALGQFRFAVMRIWEWWFRSSTILLSLSTWRCKR